MQVVEEVVADCDSSTWFVLFLVVQFFDFIGFAVMSASGRVDGSLVVTQYLCPCDRCCHQQVEATINKYQPPLHVWH